MSSDNVLTFSLGVEMTDERDYIYIKYYKTFYHANKCINNSVIDLQTYSLINWSYFEILAEAVAIFFRSFK